MFCIQNSAAITLALALTHVLVDSSSTLYCDSRRLGKEEERLEVRGGDGGGG